MFFLVCSKFKRMTIVEHMNKENILNISSISFEVHKNILKLHGIKRSQVYEIISAAFGYKSYASLKSDNPPLEDIYLLLPYDGIKNRLEELGYEKISEDERESISHLLFLDSEKSCFNNVPELIEYLTQTDSPLIQELEAELEDASSSSYNYIYEGCEIGDMDYEEADNLTIYISISAQLSVVPDKMISTDENRFELRAVVELKRITPNGFSYFEIKRSDITGHNTFYDIEQEVEDEEELEEVAK